MTTLNWDDLRYFLAVAAAGSLSGAAQQLGVNTTTVLRRVGSLEDALETRLFERERTGYRLTPAGERLSEALGPVDQRLSSLTRDFAFGTHGSEGHVRIGASDIVARSLLAGSLQEFADREPDIELEILTDPTLAGPSGAPRIIDPLRDVDVALRLARPTQGDMLMRKVGDMGFGLYASEAYLGCTEAPADMADLKRHRIIGFSRAESPFGPVWWLSRAEKGAKVVMRSNNASVRAAAARAGLGLAALPSIMGDEDGRLVRIFGPERVGALELWLMARNDLAHLPHVRAVMDFVIASVRARRSELLGRGSTVTERPVETAG